MHLDLGPAAGHDLGIEPVIKAFSADREHQQEIHSLFSRLPCDPAVIRFRQDVLEQVLSERGVI